MTNTEHDPFHLDTGLKDDYDGTVIDEWFGTTDNAGDTLFLFLKIAADDGEEVERRYSCGDGWQTFDGGVTAEHATRKFFQNNSNIGLLVTRAFSIGAEEQLRKRSAELNNLGPKHAKLWHGFRGHWNVESETFKIKDRDEGSETFGQMVERTSNRLLPTSFEAFVEQATSQPTNTPPISAAPQQTTATDEAATAQSSNEPTPGPFVNVPVGQQQMIRALAKQNGFAEWIDKVMALPGVIENDTLMAGISDEAFYNQLRDH